MEKNSHTFSSSPDRNVGCFSILKSFIPSHGDDYDKDYSSSDDETYLNISIYKSSGAGKLDSSDRLLLLRKQMFERGIGAYIVPSEDQHQSEYTSDSDKRRTYISGFTGSAGVVVVTLNDEINIAGEAVLSTDGRYFLQAAKELDNNWFLLKQGVPSYPSWIEWAITKTKANTFSNVISVDPKLISKKLGDSIQKKCAENGLKFVPEMDNLVDWVWENQPERSRSPIYELPLEFTGETTQSKLDRLRTDLIKNQSDTLIVSALDDIAWLFNLRGDDIVYNPVFFAYSIVTLNNITLYVNPDKLSSATVSYLSGLNGFKLRNYEAFWEDLSKIEVVDKKITLSSNASYAIYQSINSDQIQYNSLITKFKAVKNSTELSNAKTAQVKDAVALARFYSWLEQKLLNGETIDEIQAAQKNYYYRSQLSNFKGLSFETISSSGPNAAIIHYAPTPEDFAVIDPKKIYLCDSGAQFFEGTTDITRTFHFTKPTYEQKKTYTLVLKGHIALASEVFPPTVQGASLDALARTPLWKEGLDYRHGTGHGLGSFLSVHEGPIGIGTGASAPVQPGNIISDEPGYYKDGEYGIRIESELMVVKSGVWFNEVEFLKFDYITKVPFCRKLIKKDMLTKEETVWINHYHKDVKHAILPYLEASGDKRAMKWLLRETSPLRVY